MLTRIVGLYGRITDRLTPKRLAYTINNVPVAFETARCGVAFGDLMVAGVALAGVLSTFPAPAAGQAPAYRVPRTADGKPNLNGIWQANNTADWDLQGHAA